MTLVAISGTLRSLDPLISLTTTDERIPCCYSVLPGSFIWCSASRRPVSTTASKQHRYKRWPAVVLPRLSSISFRHRIPHKHYWRDHSLSTSHVISTNQYQPGKQATIVPAELCPVRKLFLGLLVCRSNQQSDGWQIAKTRLQNFQRRGYRSPPSDNPVSTRPTNLHPPNYRLSLGQEQVTLPLRRAVPRRLGVIPPQQLTDFLLGLLGLLIIYRKVRYSATKDTQDPSNRQSVELRPLRSW